MNVSRDILNDEYAAQVWSAILFLSLLMVAGMIGNLLVCVVYCFDHSKVNNRFVLALAGIDLVNCVISIPGDIADLALKYSFGDSYLCPTKSFTVTFCALASATTLIAISTERFRKVCKPCGWQTTIRTSNFAIVSSILLSLLCASPILIERRRKTGFVEGVDTAECLRGETYLYKIYNFFLFFLFISGCLILIILYSLIWHRLRQQKHFKDQSRCQNLKLSTVHAKDNCPEIEDGEQMNDKPLPQNVSPKLTTVTSSKSLPSSAKSTWLTSHSKSIASEISLGSGLSIEDSRSGEESINFPSNQDDRRNKTKKPKPPDGSTIVDKTTIMMLMVTVVFILSFLPYMCLTSATDIHPESFQNMTSVQLASYQVFYRFHFLNSVLNPFIYSFFSLQFRKQFGTLRRTLMRKWRHG